MIDTIEPSPCVRVPKKDKNDIVKYGNSIVDNIKDIHKEISTPISTNGKLSEEDKKRNPLKQIMIKALSSIWYDKEDAAVRSTANLQAENLREFDDNCFNRAIYLNQSSGAMGNGHNAIMLINENDYAVVFSFFATENQFPDALLTKAEVRFAVLTPDEMNNVLYGDGKIENMIASDGEVQSETYDRHLYFDIDNSQGYNMYHKAVSLFDLPGYYALIGRQCDNIAQDIFSQGGIDLRWSLIPNNSFGVETTRRDMTNG